MKLFTPRKGAAGRQGDDETQSAVTLEAISTRLDKLERVVTDLKQNIDLIPAIVRKLYLDGQSLPAPYDLLSERFGYRYRSICSIVEKWQQVRDSRRTPDFSEDANGAA